MSRRHTHEPGGSMCPAVGPTGCPRCGAPEVDALGLRTVYECGSSNYDQRPGTFRPSAGCVVRPVRPGVEPSGYTGARREAAESARRHEDLHRVASRMRSREGARCRVDDPEHERDRGGARLSDEEVRAILRALSDPRADGQGTHDENVAATLAYLAAVERCGDGYRDLLDARVEVLALRAERDRLRAAALVAIRNAWSSGYTAALADIKSGEVKIDRRRRQPIQPPVAWQSQCSDPEMYLQEAIEAADAALADGRAP